MTVQLLRSTPRPGGLTEVVLFDNDTRVTALVDPSILESPHRDTTFAVIVEHERERLAKAAMLVRPQSELAP